MLMACDTIQHTRGLLLLLLVCLHRLETMNDARQGLIARLKIAEKEKDALEGRKAEAESFLAKQVQKRVCSTHMLAHIRVQKVGAHTMEHYQSGSNSFPRRRRCIRSAFMAPPSTSHKPRYGLWRWECGAVACTWLV